MKSIIKSKVKKIKIVKKKFFQEKFRSKKIFYTRVVEKYFFELAFLYTKFYAVIYALFTIISYNLLINVYV